jgi:hypothetical protein
MKSIIVSLLIILHFSIAGFGQNNANANISGTWVNASMGYELVLILQPNGTGSLEEEAIQYSINGNVISIHTSYETTNYTYLLSGSSLTLSDGDLEYPVTFMKRGGNQVTSSANIGTIPQASSTDISGTWQGVGGTLEFGKDGTMKYNNVNYNYKVQNGVITLIGYDGSQNMNYSLSGDKLILSSGGQSATYSRSTGNTVSPSAVPSAMPGGNANGSIDASMAGRWCESSTYTNTYQGGGSSHSTCIVLNQDGTYEYNSEGSVSGYTPGAYGASNSQGSDRGTWKVQGNTLISVSQVTGQTKSYQFYKQNNKNNDPMLVIDGREFVTFYSKSPW